MLKIRLRRGGMRNAPYYRIVVSDSLRTPSASTVDEVGHYDPSRETHKIKLNKDRVNYWLGKGAKMSDTVRSIVKRAQ